AVDAADLAGRRRDRPGRAGDAAAGREQAAVRDVLPAEPGRLLGGRGVPARAGAAFPRGWAWRAVRGVPCAAFGAPDGRRASTAIRPPTRLKGASGAPITGPSVRESSRLCTSHRNLERMGSAPP